MKNFFMLILMLIFVACNTNSHNDSKKTEDSKNVTPIEKKSSIENSLNNIYTNYEDAFKVAKEQNLPLFIFFSITRCRWCVKLKETTLRNEILVDRLNHEFVVLFLDRDKSKYPSKYKIRGVPAIYFTDKNEEVFTSMVGYHKNPQDYLKWVNYIKIELEH